MTKRVLIINEGFSSNLGDQAIRQSMEQLMQRLGFETDFCYFTNPGLHQMPVYKYTNSTVNSVSGGLFATIKKKLAYVFSIYIYCRYFIKLNKQIKTRLLGHSYDMLLIGGGQLINSSKKITLNFFAISLYLWTKIFSKQPAPPVYMIGVGAADNFHAVEKWLYKKALNRVAGVWVRDRFSQQSLSKNFKKESHLMPDVAFFEPEILTSPKKRNTALVGIYSYDEYMGKFETREKNKSAYYEHWFSIVNKYRAKGLNVLLFYTTTSDAVETLLFQQYLQTKQVNAAVADIQSLEDLNSLYEEADFVYSARMHALILGLKKGCKAEAYIISQKLKSFSDEYIQTAETPPQLSKRVYEIMRRCF